MKTSITLEEYRHGVRPIKFAVFEREPQYTKEPNSVILGLFDSAEEAEAARQKYGYSSSNYFVGPHCLKIANEKH